MVSSPVITPMRIPEVVNPPIPGEDHIYYGNIHLKQLRLPTNSSNTLRGTTTSFPRYSEDGSIEGDLDIYEAAAAGKLNRIKVLLAPRGSGETSSAFLRANELNPSTGLTPLHYAASRGHYEIVKWLIDTGAAIVDLEDQTGETALLKASYSGHSSVVAYLLQKDANVSLRDSDGWTALHNASAQGYLKIVKYLVEHAKACVDVQSNVGYTPLMNAASKGHVKIVEYLLDHFANPFIKNKLGETAYDAAATSLEIYVCELLEKTERDWWKGKRQLPKQLTDLPNFDLPYDPNVCHVTFPDIIHENQRSNSTFGLSLRGQKYTPSKGDSRGPWTFPDGRPTSKDDMKVPIGPISSSASIASNGTSSKSIVWCWVTDWQVDMSHPRIDSQGWQYAKNFDESDENWYSTPPANSGSCVRRRRWVRVMKHQIDYPEDGVLQFVESNGQHNGNDYIERAEAIIKNAKAVSETDQLSLYKEAIAILMDGSKADTSHTSRKQEAAALMKSFLAHYEHLDTRLKSKGIDTGGVPTSPSFKDVPLSKSSSPTPPLKMEPPPINQARNDTTITNLNAPSTTSLRSNETFDSPWNNTVQSDDIVNTPIVSDSSMVSPTPAQTQTGLNFTNAKANDLAPVVRWENDEEVNECRRCRKKFGLWNRRHHCRRCGQVVCDKCSTARVPLPSDQVLTDPSQSSEIQASHHRVCDSCFTAFNRSRSNSFTSTTFVASSSSVTNHRRNTSNNSTMNECPVCNASLSGGASAQEHIKNCVEDGGNSVSGYKYVGEQH